MIMSAALARNASPEAEILGPYREHDLERDLSPVQGLTVECAKCDPDNPRAVPQTKCPVCKGSGRALVALPTIVEEMRDARMELLVGPKRLQSKRAQSDDEYVDPNDCC
jgi:hypothetical protein